MDVDVLANIVAFSPKLILIMKIKVPRASVRARIWPVLVLVLAAIAVSYMAGSESTYRNILHQINYNGITLSQEEDAHELGRTAVITLRRP